MQCKYQLLLEDICGDESAVFNLELPTSGSWKLRGGTWKVKSKFQKLEIGVPISKLQPPEVGSWNPTTRSRLLELRFPIPTFQLPDFGCWKLKSNFRNLEVGNQGPEVASWKLEVGS